MENEKLKILSSQLDELTGTKKEAEIHSPINNKDAVLFFSFDIVNSTSYKAINYFGWAQVLNLIFKELSKNVYNQIVGSEMWRVLGDEAIFIKRVRDEEELYGYVNKIFRIMITTIHQIKNGEFFKDDKNFKTMKLQNTLSLKSTVWLTAVTNIGDISNDDIFQDDADNIFECYHSQEGNKIFEFLGNDIDTGFRIAKQTQDSRMVLNYELAYLLSQKTENLSYLHIITYRKLKGIWKERLYPIIWYHDPKAYLKLYDKEIELEESFAFDACEESDLVREYYDNRDTNRTNLVIRDEKMYSEPYYALSKILRDRELDEKITELKKIIKEPFHDRPKYMNPELMQLHCVAVCFKKYEDGFKILVAQRSDSREKHKGKWEFGCAKATVDKNIAEKIKEEYKQDFNIDIEPVLDKNREMKEPIPIALYHVEHTSHPGKNDKGIITLAEIVDNCNPDDFKGTDKHSHIKWISENDLDDIKEHSSDTVPDFKQTLIAAFDKIKSLDKEKNGTTAK